MSLQYILATARPVRRRRKGWWAAMAQTTSSTDLCGDSTRDPEARLYAPVQRHRNSKKNRMSRPRIYSVAITAILGHTHAGEKSGIPISRFGLFRFLDHLVEELRKLILNSRDLHLSGAKDVKIPLKSSLRNGIRAPHSLVLPTFYRFEWVFILRVS
ncbi:hypothetical protein IW262DRAFT_1296880 [Armillaria fumosa]|nr:hypothetical protein IW262DRAFT_1296880 [Armillaria fumosa]